jgi:hypothetical protein
LTQNVSFLHVSETHYNLTRLKHYHMLLVGCVGCKSYGCHCIATINPRSFTQNFIIQAKVYIQNFHLTQNFTHKLSERAGLI